MRDYDAEREQKSNRSHLSAFISRPSLFGSVVTMQAECPRDCGRNAQTANASVIIRESLITYSRNLNEA
jgi:hypothetical protein